jgi:hypothetical protein
MRMINLGLFVAFILLAFSCSKEEKILEGETPPRYFFVVFANEPAALQLVEAQSSKIIDPDAFYSANAKRLDKITQIVEFRDLLYIFQSKSHKITIATRDSLKVIKELTWSDSEIMPSSIAFPNATTGFVSFADTSIIAVLDLTNFVVARYIKVEAPVTFLENADYYILGVSPANGTLIIIDSRTYSVITSKPIGDYPFSLGYNSFRNTVYTICMGNGKIDTSVEKSPAKLVAITYPDFNISSQTELNIGSISSKTLIPSGLSVPGKYFGFISTLSGLLRFSLTNPSQIQRYIAGEFTNIMYDYRKDQVLALSRSGDQTLLYVINPNDASIISKYTFNRRISLVFPR